MDLLCDNCLTLIEAGDQKHQVLLVGPNGPCGEAIICHGCAKEQLERMVAYFAQWNEVPATDAEKLADYMRGQE